MRCLTRVLVALTALFALAACTTTTTGTPARPVGDACHLLTSEIANAALPKRVYHLGPKHTVAGVTGCFYGDERDPALLSLNTILLLQVNQQFATTHHETIHRVASQGANDCVPGTRRHLGASAHIGSGVTVCLGKLGPVRGGWEQRGDAYSLDIYALATSGDSYDARLNTFETTVRAISARIG